jgi:hypothetical protein
MHYKRIAGMFVATCLIWQSLLQVAHAQEDQAKPDRFRVFAGGFFAKLDTDSEVTTGGRGGRTFNLEDDLGLKDDDEVIVGGFRWRFGKRHSLGIMHMTLDRDADQNLTRELSIGDQTFTINATTMTTFDYKTTHVDYRYAFYSTDRLDAGLLLGLSNIEFDFEVVADVAFPGGGVLTQSVHESEGFPVPSIGLGFRYALNEDWYLRAGATYLEYDDGEWDASLLLAGVGVEWFPWRHFGFGLGYDLVQIEYDENNDPDDDEFDVKFDYDGFQLRVIGRF